MVTLIYYYYIAAVLQLSVRKSVRLFKWDVKLYLPYHTIRLYVRILVLIVNSSKTADVYQCK